MIVQVFNKDVLKVLTVFCISPGARFQRRELQERTRMNNVNLDNALGLLLRSGVLKKDRRFLCLDLNEEVKKIVELVSGQYKFLREVPLDVYFSVLEVVWFLSRFECDVYLFGSYVKLVFKEGSDIDIAVVSDRVRSEAKKEISKLVRKVEKKYGKDIQVHYFSEKFYKSKKDLLVKDILKNGIKLI